MQVTDSNPMVGIEGRAGLLRKLADALAANKEYFGEDGRPGHLVGSSHMLLLTLIFTFISILGIAYRYLHPVVLKTDGPNHRLPCSQCQARRYSYNDSCLRPLGCPHRRPCLYLASAAHSRRRRAWRRLAVPGSRAVA
jgi:hypothetical protein